MAENDDPSDKGPGAPVAPASEPAEPENRRARRAAASQQGRQQRDRERRRAAESGLDAGERVDDALARGTDRGFRWLKEHFNIVQWLIVGGVAGWIGFQIYSWRVDKTGAKISDELAQGADAEFGRIGSPEDEGKRDERGSIDARRIFTTDEERFKAAEGAYQKVSAERPGTPAAALAKLGLAGVFYDQGKYDEARKLYEQAYGSELAKLDPEARGRSLEGIGLCLEAKGDRDAALKRFAELENAEIPGFRELALYHQGRVLHAKGDDAGAKERLKKALEKLEKAEKAEKDKAPSDAPPSYLAEVTRDLLQRIDPKSVPAPSADEALRKALESFQKKLPAGMTRLPTPAGPE